MGGFGELLSRINIAKNCYGIFRKRENKVLFEKAEYDFNE